MKTETILKINNDIYLKNYLKYNSYLFKYLYRDDNYLDIIINEYKKYYSLDINSKINNFKDRLKLINTFIDLIK